MRLVTVVTFKTRDSVVCEYGETLFDVETVCVGLEEDNAEV